MKSYIKKLDDFLEHNMYNVNCFYIVNSLKFDIFNTLKIFSFNKFSFSLNLFVISSNVTVLLSVNVSNPLSFNNAIAILCLSNI